MNLRIDRPAIKALCQKYHIRRLSLFGSVLSADFRPDSDVDILVEFAPGHVPGLAFFNIEAELSTLLGRRVDLNTPQFLGRHFRHKVLAEAQVEYEAS